MFAGISIVILILLLLFPQFAIEGASEGLTLWFHTVLPTLAPFMIGTRLISSAGAIPILMRPVAPIFRLLFGLSESGSYILCCGLLCGYPLGASLCSDFLREGRISKNEAQILLAICNHPSPMFLTGYVTSLLPVRSSAPLMLFCLYFPILPISVAARWIYHPDANGSNANENDRHGSGSTHIDSFNGQTAFIQPAQSIEQILMNTSEAMVLIGNYIMLFSILACWIRHLPFLSPQLCALCAGFAEITTGTKQICKVFSRREALLPTLTVTAFGGLSGIFQTKGVLSCFQNPKNREEPSRKRNANPRSTAQNASGNDVESSLRVSPHRKSTGIPAETSRTQNTGLSIRHYICWKTLHALLTCICVIVLT